MCFPEGARAASRQAAVPAVPVFRSQFTKPFRAVPRPSCGPFARSAVGRCLVTELPRFPDSRSARRKGGSPPWARCRTNLFRRHGSDAAALETQSKGPASVGSTPRLANGSLKIPHLLYPHSRVPETQLCSAFGLESLTHLQP